jgi:hypothetical protein
LSSEAEPLNGHSQAEPGNEQTAQKLYEQKTLERHKVNSLGSAWGRVKQEISRILQ